VTSEQDQDTPKDRDSVHKAKLLSAVASVVSVLAVLLAALTTVQERIWLPNTLNTLYVSLAGALVAALSSIAVGAAIRKRRRPREVFIVYSRADLPIAREIAVMLREAGFSPWLDVEQLVPGQNWPEAVATALAQSGAAVVLMSKSLSSSKSAQMELLLATRLLTAKDKRTFPLIPVRLDDSEPPKPLKHVLWVDWRDSGARGSLLRGLTKATE
jgi:hypothetical protein